ncbi:EPIDERMAL PATTERNING FACTOR-like protein [Corchorus olitorius]|uniref:Epidermal patterning factor-like protein n=1 Tax=Corchorus olitorius TaxID=93759 RepID=A0A1R3J7M1_9ROSI|nr:EPIDERMAL PATTERNING FACTOR-like protein [Corchorus olitorius]
MAASSFYHQYKLRIAATLICFLAFLPSKPGGLGTLMNEREKLQVGSRPPVCLNKCSSCRPCMATLVIQPPLQKRYTKSSHEEGDYYYLLSWKCKCGNKLYRP